MCDIFIQQMNELEEYINNLKIQINMDLLTEDGSAPGDGTQGI